MRGRSPAIRRGPRAGSGLGALDLVVRAVLGSLRLGAVLRLGRIDEFGELGVDVVERDVLERACLGGIVGGGRRRILVRGGLVVLLGVLRGLGLLGVLRGLGVLCSLG